MHIWQKKRINVVISPDLLVKKEHGLFTVSHIRTLTAFRKGSRNAQVKTSSTNEKLKALKMLTSKRGITLLIGVLFTNCTKLTHSFDTCEASEAHSSQAYNVFSMSSQELSYLFQNSLLQITENTAKLGITLAPNAELINCGTKQHTKCVQWDLPHNSSNHDSFWK